MNKIYSWAPRTLALLLIAQTSSHAFADFQADSAAMIGAWRWVRTYGGMAGANVTPPSSGWSRTLFFRRDATYAYWEQDSVASHLICTGKFTVHPSIYGRIEDGPRASIWVDMEGWWWHLDQKQLIAFLGSTGMLMYPGSEDGTILYSVSDAQKSEFIRDSERKEPTDPPGGRIAGARPPRLLSSFRGSYEADMTFAMRQVLWGAGPIYEWDDRQFPPSVLGSYVYTSNQIPSAVVGDFDGDTLADIAIYGSTTTDWSESKVLCVLSNREKPRAVEVLREPIVRDPPAGPDTTVRAFREPHPALYLSLIHAGRLLRSADDKPLILTTDAILVTRLSGESTPYYYSGDNFRKGGPLVGKDRAKAQRK
jgi:hypothetical protein